MRLVNIFTLQLEEFFENDIPPYCILSHRWQGKEITYKDFVKGRNKDSAGYQKISDFCKFVKIQNEVFPRTLQDRASYVKWVWIDTCRLHSILQHRTLSR